jgi:F0F1-type ATP synthase membrane subunit b/b'
MTDFTTGQFIDAVTNIKDAFLNIKKENDDLIETNKYLVMEIKRLEADLLQMTLEKKDGKLVSREAKKEAEKKEKEAKKEAKKEAEKKEKEAKKEAEKKEKEAKKEVVEKKAILEAIQIEETAAKKQSEQLLDGELSEEKVIVTKFTFEGKDYLRDEKNVVYDYNSQEEIGVWTGIMIELYDAGDFKVWILYLKMMRYIQLFYQAVLDKKSEYELYELKLKALHTYALALEEFHEEEDCMNLILRMRTAIETLDLHVV